MYIKSIVLSAILALGLAAIVSAQLPLNDFGSGSVQPKEWMYFTYPIGGLREGDMIIADISDNTNTDIQLYAQFDRNPTSGDSWNFAYYQNINSVAFERIFGRCCNFR
jgi:hypothetical protein